MDAQIRRPEAARRLARMKRGRQRPTRRRELRYWRGGAQLVVGMDEVGRGPLAGPLVAAAVALPSGRRPVWLSQVRDSKQLSEVQRRRLAPQIRAEAAAWSVAWLAASEIDADGLAAALRCVYRRALARLPRLPDVVLADGADQLRLPCPTEMVIRGDAAVASIAAASIIAKDARDAYMRALHCRHPDYGFAQHKGYPTAQHLRALRQFGPCPEHRCSFAPVAALAQTPLPFHAEADDSS